MDKVFHAGEEHIHNLLGVAEDAHQLEGMIKSKLPAAAIRFLPAFDFVLAASIDRSGHVWTSFLTGPKGFLSVVNEQTLALSVASDEQFLENIKFNDEVGLLFINFEARIRLRVNGTIKSENDRWLVAIRQSYFNCPKYIQARKAEFTHENHRTNKSAETAFNESHRTLIQEADTFFISTYAPEQGADCSHRGGSPGFVEVMDSHSLRWRDYPGNNLYNTIGNLDVNPNCGLLFLDFKNNRTLQLTGSARFIIQDPENQYIEFKLELINDASDATPFHWTFLGYSNFNFVD